MSTPNNQQELAGFIVEKVVKVLCERETFEEIEAMIGYFPRQVLISTVKVLCEDGRPAAIRVLVALMRSHALVDEWDRGEWYVGDDVREALLKIGEPAVEPLIQSFKSQRADKSKVVEILGRIGGKRALEFLLETQNYPDNGISQTCTGKRKKQTKTWAKVKNIEQWIRKRSP